MADLPAIALKLVRQTRIGQRQMAAGETLVNATAPLDRHTLIRQVEKLVGEGCYGSRPQYTLLADIQALKRAGLNVRYSRTKERKGYYVPTPDQEAEAKATRLLRRIGWHPSNLAQIKVYANMPSARKIAQMLQLRHEQIELLRLRLRQEHPEATDRELVVMLRDHLIRV